MMPQSFQISFTENLFCTIKRVLNYWHGEVFIVEDGINYKFETCFGNTAEDVKFDWPARLNLMAAERFSFTTVHISKVQY